jgi:hypothetical protein
MRGKVTERLYQLLLAHESWYQRAKTKEQRSELNFELCDLNF